MGRGWESKVLDVVFGGREKLDVLNLICACEELIEFVGEPSRDDIGSEGVILLTVGLNVMPHFLEHANFCWFLIA